MRILIVEDAACMALPMQATLSKQGHEVDVIVGVRSFEPFVGITEEKPEQFTNVPLDVTGYDLALVDGNLIGKIEGPAIVAALVANGVQCVAISSKPDYNDKMVGNGASHGFIKQCVFAALMLDGITAEDIRQPSTELTDNINAYDQRLKDDQALRRQLDAIFMQYLQR